MHNWPTDPREAAVRLDAFERVMGRAHAEGAFLGAMGEVVAGWMSDPGTGT
jgi:hypothetical protein